MNDLSGRRVLVVEDETMIAMALEDTLNEAGCESVAVAATLEQALRNVGSEQFDVALLDVTLHGAKVYPVADALAASAVPFVFMTGHTAQHLPERHRERPVVGKPYDPAALVSMLARLAAGTQTRQADRRR